MVNFLGEKVHSVTWLEDFLTSKWPGCLDILAPPLSPSGKWNEICHPWWRNERL